MAGYWSNQGDFECNLYWGKSEVSGQTWRGNIYLNFFCVDDVDPACFEIIKREFSRSHKRSRRWIQNAYVQAAVRPPVRNLLSQVQFTVSQEVPLAREQLLIGGNRRMRMIHPAVGKSTVIHKHGFDRLGFDREVFARMGPAEAVAPQFFGLDKGGASFSEAYFIGTPANRFPIDQQADYCHDATERLILEVHRPSLRTVLVSDYLDQLAHRLGEFSETFTETILPLLKWLSERVGDASLGLVFSHGDFQGANILINGEVLHIIDWENATERSQLYDLATMESEIRLSADSVQAWCDQTEKWLHQSNNFPALEVSADGRDEQLLYAVVWWIEEMVFQLEDAELSPFANVEAAIDEQRLNVNVVLKFLIALGL
ncbi:aminoglycoside phosphotransferase family protein [Akkermansiaceae bacterium]|nr:aminoglycoside phosphotransferase family protein [Akkermansiaceae bacterium]